MQLLRYIPVRIKTRWDEDGVRAKALGAGGGHCGMNTKLPCLIAAGSHHATAVGFAAHNNRVAAQLRLVSLLDGSKKGIHVDMDNLALAGRHGRVY